MNTELPITKNNPSKRKLGVVLYSLGILIGMLILTSVTWAYLEADFYFGFGAPAKEPLLTFNCPIVMTMRETGTITLDLVNPLDKAVEPVVDIDISNPGPFRNIRTKTMVEPGETKQLQWSVDSEDVVFGHLILVTVYVFPVSSLPSRHGTCGILALDLPILSGKGALITFLTLAVLCVLAGAFLWVRNNRPIEGKKRNTAIALLLLALFVFIGVIVSLQGMWGTSLMFLALTVLLILAISMFFAQ